MKAEPTALRRLLDVQRIDTAIGQLEHRMQTLPEHEKLKERQAVRSGLGQELISAETVLSDATTAQERAEADLEPVRQRLVKDRDLVDGGTVSDPKILSSLLAEIDHLTTRIATLEDAELELMQAREDAETTRTAIVDKKTAIENDMRVLLASRDEAAKALSATVAEERADRENLVKDVPAPLLDLYEKIRSRNGGVGAAELKGRRCTGCGIEATAADYESYVKAAADEVIRCEECSRILVRSEDS